MVDNSSEAVVLALCLEIKNGLQNYPCTGQNNYATAPFFYKKNRTVA